MPAVHYPSPPAAESRAPAVHAEGLSRRYGALRALSEVSFSLHPGEGLALFGPNGAGKSTLLRILAGVLKPTSGVATVGGVRLSGDATARARTGLVAHASMLYAALTPRENVEFAARLYGVADGARAAQGVLERLGALRFADVPVRTLSRGQQQRVSIARALVHRPDLLLLDEPFSGLDEPGGESLAQLLLTLRGDGVSLVVVTHNIAEGMRLATHCAILIGGRLAHFARRDELDPSSYPGLYSSLVSAASDSGSGRGAAVV